MGPTMEAGHRLDSRRSLAHAAVLGGTPARTLGEKTTGLRWVPLINTRPQAGAPPVRRPRNGAVLEWLVRLRVCRPAVAARDLAAAHHVAPDTIRVEVNHLARSLDLPVRPRGRPRNS